MSAEPCDICRHPHTPGPWAWREIDGELILQSTSRECRHWRRRNRVMELGWVLAQMDDAKPAVPPSAADRRLIAAAPEMLDALRSARDRFLTVRKYLCSDRSDHAIGHCNDEIERLNAVIEKVESA